jgi:hypothetical protein
VPDESILEIECFEGKKFIEKFPFESKEESGGPAAIIDKKSVQLIDRQKFKIILSKKNKEKIIDILRKEDISNIIVHMKIYKEELYLEVHDGLHLGSIYVSEKIDKKFLDDLEEKHIILFNVTESKIDKGAVTGIQFRPARNGKILYLDPLRETEAQMEKKIENLSNINADFRTVISYNPLTEKMHEKMKKLGIKYYRIEVDYPEFEDFFNDILWKKGLL